MKSCSDRCPECQRKIFEEAMKPKKKKCQDCGEEYEEKPWPIKNPNIPDASLPRYGNIPIPMHDPNCQIEISKNGWWSIIPPRCTCGLFAYPESTKTITTTGTI